MISIIIPVYNTAPYLRQALDSVLSQSYRDIQVICVNDGSTDESPAILQEYADKDSRVEIISQVNSGPSKARNTGLEYVKGEYLMFLDSDDWLEAQTLEKALFLMRDKQVDILFWGYRKVYSSKKSEIVQVWKDERLFAYENMTALTSFLICPTAEELRNPAITDSLGTIWGKLYKSSLFLTNGIHFKDTKIIGSAEDVLTNIEVFSYAQNAHFTPFILHNYRKNNSTSYTRTYKTKLMTQWLALFNRIEALIEKRQLGNNARAALACRKSISIIGLGLNELLATTSIRNKYHAISKIIHSAWYKSSISKTQFKKLPPHWKIFFFCAKRGITFGVLALLCAIHLIINKKAGI